MYEPMLAEIFINLISVQKLSAVKPSTLYIHQIR